MARFPAFETMDSYSFTELFSGSFLRSRLAFQARDGSSNLSGCTKVQMHIHFAGPICSNLLRKKFSVFLSMMWT
jgi:hypothetical protein